MPSFLMAAAFVTETIDYAIDRIKQSLLVEADRSLRSLAQEFDTFIITNQTMAATNHPEHGLEANENTVFDILIIQIVRAKLNNAISSLDDNNEDETITILERVAQLLNKGIVTRKSILGLDLSDEDDEQESE
jgi:hypothetical protein